MVVAHNRDKFNCQNCRFQRHCDDSNPAPFPVFVIPEIGLASRTCLLPMIEEGSRHLIAQYQHYKNGLLPYAGGMLDQPAAFSEAMNLIESRIEESSRESKRC